MSVSGVCKRMQNIIPIFSVATKINLRAWNKVVRWSGKQNQKLLCRFY